MTEWPLVFFFTYVVPMLCISSLIASVAWVSCCLAFYAVNTFMACSIW